MRYRDDAATLKHERQHVISQIGVPKYGSFLLREIFIGCFRPISSLGVISSKALRGVASHLKAEIDCCAMLLATVASLIMRKW